MTSTYYAGVIHYTFHFRRSTNNIRHSLVWVDASEAYIARIVAIDGTKANVAVLSPISTPRVLDFPPLGVHSNQQYAVVGLHRAILECAVLVVLEVASIYAN